MGERIFWVRYSVSAYEIKYFWPRYGVDIPTCTQKEVRFENLGNDAGNPLHLIGDMGERFDMCGE
jgi:hypothetical protein